MLIAIEGPNGVGKSELTAALTNHLTTQGQPVYKTREPTDSSLGHAIRQMEPLMTGRALALACAADRHYHLAHEVLPALESGQWVVTDRYLPSSLVLQRIDGMEIQEIYEINRGVRAADVVVYLEEAPSILRRRLSERDSLSRLERTGGPEAELALYRDAHDFLAGKGWQQLRFDSTDQSSEELAARIASEL